MKLLFVITIVLALAVPGFGAGTVQQTLTQLGQTNNWVVAYQWTGDGITGAVPLAPAQLQGCCQGYSIVQVETVPGSPAPTSGYSVSINDAAGVDALGGAAASLSSTTAQSFAAASSAPPLQGTFSLVITGQTAAGAKGTVFVFMMKPGTVNTAKLGSGTSSSPNWLTIASPPFVDARKYNWTPQAPGGILFAGVCSFSLQPLPSGVVANSNIYISNGVGAPETLTVLSVSGNVVTGNCANGHSGAWTVGPVLQGVQEAVMVAGQSGTVVLPAGVWKQYGPVNNALDVSIFGMGRRSTIIQPQNSNSDVFHLSGGSTHVWSVGGFAVIPSVGQTGGAVFVLNNHDFGCYGDIYIESMWNGFDLKQTVYPEFRGVVIHGILNSAFMAEDGYQHQWSITDCNWFGNVGGSQTNDIVSIKGTVAGASIVNLALQGGFNNIHISNSTGPVNELLLSNITFDSYAANGLAADGSGGGSDWGISNVKAAAISTSSGAAIEFNRSASTGAYSHVTIAGLTGGASGNGQWALFLNNISYVTASRIDWIGTGVNTIFNVPVYIDNAAGTVSHLVVSNLTGTAWQYPVIIQAAAHTNLLFSASDFSGAASGVQNNTTGSGPVIFDSVIGVDKAFTTPTIGSIASNTITLGAVPAPIVIVSADGSGGVSTLTAPNGTQWVGYRVKIVATHANGIVFNASGNIRTSKTLTTGQSAILDWDGSKWNTNQ